MPYFFMLMKLCQRSQFKRFSVFLHRSKVRMMRMVLCLIASAVAVIQPIRGQGLGNPVTGASIAVTGSGGNSNAATSTTSGLTAETPNSVGNTSEIPNSAANRNTTERNLLRMQRGFQTTNPTQSPNPALGSRVGESQKTDLIPVSDIAPLKTTQFQRFVRDATGKDLAMYGYQLFDRGRFPNLKDIPVPANYVLGPGDEIELKIWGAVDLTARLEIDREGRITIPKVGPVSVAGVTATELDEFLKKRVSKVFTNFELSASVGKLRSIQIFVLGQARNPGAYWVSSLSTLISAIFESGGPSSSGSMRRIDLIRAGKKIASIDLYQFIQSGDTSTDYRLLPGDVVLVNPAGPRVAIQGAIDSPGIFELVANGENLGKVLAYSGASIALVAPQKVLIERVETDRPAGPRQVSEIELDATGLERGLRDGDIVSLFQISPSFGNAVTLRGNVASPLRYAFKPGMKVSDLIPSPEALIMSDYYAKKNVLVQYDRPKDVSSARLLADSKNDLAEVNWDYATIERIDRLNVRTILISFNLSKAVRDKDPAHDLTLKPGDIVSVYGLKDIDAPVDRRTQLVKISGEVNVAGIYTINPGETLKDLIQRAGGLTSNAFVFGTRFTRESTRLQQEESLESLRRRAEEQIRVQSASMTQSVTDPEKSGLLQAQLLAQRLALERVQNLRAEGRIALEIDPDRPELPAFALTDGDEVRVPPTPNSVNVFGAVSSESALMYRAGASLRDYLYRAGLSRTADLESAFVVRANGTVLANEASQDWLGRGSETFLTSRLQPGDTVFIPELTDRRSPSVRLIQGAKDWAQILYQFGLGAAAIRVLRN